MSGPHSLTRALQGPDSFKLKNLTCFYWRKNTAGGEGARLSLPSSHSNRKNKGVSEGRNDCEGFGDRVIIKKRTTVANVTHKGIFVFTLSDVYVLLRFGRSL